MKNSKNWMEYDLTLNSFATHTSNINIIIHLDNIIRSNSADDEI